MTNPYLNRTAIRDDASFVGRTAELKRLFNRIGGPQPQSVSIVGDRRIGKSSLLRALMTRRGKLLTKPENYIFVYLDMQSRLRWTPEMFFERMAAEMTSTDLDTSAITDYDGLERWCRSLQQRGRTLVLLIDEFHVLMREDSTANQLPVEFFNYLRSLANSYPVSLVVTSHVDLYRLSNDHRLSGSPLFNILHKLHLGPFTEQEAREIIEVASQHSGCVQPADEPWIISRGGYHPLYLQIACSIVFEWRAENGGQRPLDQESLDRGFMEEARPHFEGTYKLMTDSERAIMAAAARGQTAESALAPAIQDLEARGYLRHETAQLVVFSECFRGFILAQDGAGRGNQTVTPLPAAPVARIFISYARSDQDVVKDLYRRLKSIGVSPWMDDENLVVGDPWASTIDQAILSADFFLFCISTHSVDRNGVLRQELSKGLSQWYARSGSDNYLLPVMLEDCQMPTSLAAVQRVDYWREDGWVRLRDGLLTVIDRRKNLAKPTHSPPAARATSTARAGIAAPTLGWFESRALVLGLASLFAGVLLLIGGLSGEALSLLIGTVGLQRAKNWNVLLRGLEITTLLLGAGLISFAIVKQRSRAVSIVLCGLVWLVCWMLIRVDVPAPEAFALAYDRHLVQRSDDWRHLLLTFVDPDTGGVRDGSNPPNVQVWTTAQTVVGVLGSVAYDASRLNESQKNQLRAAVNHLDTVRMPAPEEGWGYFTGRVPAITEIAAWAALAEIGSVRAKLWDSDARAVMTARIKRDLSLIVARQSSSGGWSPIRDIRDDNTRTYSTVMALWALSAAFREDIRTDAWEASAVKGMNWLLNERHEQLGWVPNPRRRYQTEDFPGLTAQALVVLDLLQLALKSGTSDIRLLNAKSEFAETALSNNSIRTNARVPDSDVHVALGDSSTTLEGSSFLWYPWSRAALALLARDPELGRDVRERARREAASLTLRTEELTAYLDNALPYQLAEHLLCISIASDTPVE